MNVQQPLFKKYPRGSTARAGGGGGAGAGGGGGGGGGEGEGGGEGDEPSGLSNIYFYEKNCPRACLPAA